MLILGWGLDKIGVARRARRSCTGASRMLSVFAVMLAGSLFTACTPPSAGSGPAALPLTEHPLRGEPAPAFDVAARGGAQANLAGYAGRVVLVDFWATWCEPCRQSFPQYQKLLEEHAQDVVIVGISEDDDDKDIDRFVQNAGARFTVAWDGDKALAQRYRINSMPTLFIIDRNGLVRYVHQGFRPGDQTQIENAIESLL
jgi:cytochrome c biogenesis protein CcmG/thiol:disulfide interchange protein DsbE